MAAEASTWKDKAVTTWRQEQFRQALGRLLEVEIDLTTVRMTPDSASVDVDGVTFTLTYPERHLHLTAPCPACNRPQASKQLESLTDVGAALSRPCRDCDFLIKSGIKDVAKDREGRRHTDAA